MSAPRNPTMGELGRGGYPWCTSCGRQPFRPPSHMTLVQLGQSRPPSCSFGASEPQIATQRYNWNPRRDHTISAFISTDTPSLYQGSQMKVSFSNVISWGDFFFGGVFFSRYAEDRSLTRPYLGSRPCQSDAPCIPRPQLTDVNKRERHRSH